MQGCLLHWVRLRTLHSDLRLAGANDDDKLPSMETTVVNVVGEFALLAQFLEGRRFVP